MTAVGKLPATRRYAAKDDGNDERYTRPATVRLCAQLAGVPCFTLDVAACRAAHVAPEYFTRAHDGRRQPWWGAVWCNPPYSELLPWLEHAWAEMACGRPHVIAMLLPSVRCEQRWWAEHVEPFRDGRRERVKGVPLTTHFFKGRHSFDRPGRTRTKHNRPPFGLVLLVWRRTR